MTKFIIFLKFKTNLIKVHELIPNFTKNTENKNICYPYNCHLYIKETHYKPND